MIDEFLGAPSFVGPGFPLVLLARASLWGTAAIPVASHAVTSVRYPKILARPSFNQPSSGFKPLDGFKYPPKQFQIR